jgi:hypothetical protein
MKKKPDICFLVASKNGLEYVAEEHGYKKPNSAVIREATRKVGCKTHVIECDDPFDPESIGDALGQVLERLRSDDEVIINYSGGTQAMSLVLGSIAVVLSRIMSIQIIYSTARPGRKEEILDHSKELRELFRKLHEIIPKMPK